MNIMDMDMNLDREWTVEEIEKFAVRVNESTDHMGVIDFVAKISSHKSPWSNLNTVRLYGKIRSRVVAAIESDDGKAWSKRANEQAEQKAFVRQIKLPGEA